MAEILDNRHFVKYNLFYFGAGLLFIISPLIFRDSFSESPYLSRFTFYFGFFIVFIAIAAMVKRLIIDSKETKNVTPEDIHNVDAE